MEVERRRRASAAGLTRRLRMVRQRNARVNASLASARRCAALTRAIRRRMPAVIDAPAMRRRPLRRLGCRGTHAGHPHAFLRATCWPRAGPSAHILCDNITRGTQDVNDPDRPLGPRRRAAGGVVHVLGSASALIGTPVGGGTERRPICRRRSERKLLEPEPVVSETAIPSSVRARVRGDVGTR